MRNDLPYYHTARHRLHGLTDTIDGFHMAMSLRHWLYLAQSLRHDLLLEYDITDWVPAVTDVDHPGHTHHNINPHAIPYVTYSQHTQWIPNATQDGNVEPNTGPDNNTPSHGMVRTLAETYERNTSGLHTDNHDPGDVEENPGHPRGKPTPPIRG